ncbi:hypothetical protein L3V82_03120 [Thiotrichales bacterium 19S3-7]|nr:hypothetical protein [Thiotrichales bacterium 19S3-7]MCF6801161.1 hypothetical protein [Thiotrichales bacterium 19S3-11]
MNNPTIDPELKLKKSFLKKIKLSDPTMILLALIIILLLVILVQQFSDSAKTEKLNTQINKIASSVKSNHQTQTKILSNLDQHAKAIASINAGYGQINQTINATAKNQSIMQGKLTNQFQQISKSITNNTQSLDAILKLLNAQTSQGNHQEPAISSILSIPKGFKHTDQYTINGVAPYGVILQDSKGNFLIAQLNKQLSVGTISVITQGYIIAGDYVITYQHDKIQNNVSVIKK